MNDTDKYLFLIGVVFKELMFLILITAIIIIYCSLDTEENKTAEAAKAAKALAEAAKASSEVPEAASQEAAKSVSLFDLLIKAAEQFLQLLKAQTIPGFTFYIVFIFYYIVSIVIGYLYNPPPRGSRKDKIKDWWTFMGNETIYRMFIIFVGPLAIFVSLGILYMLAIVGQPKLLQSIRNLTTLKKIMAAIVCVLFIYFLIEIIVNVTSKRPIFKRGSLETNILRGATLYTTIGIMAGLTFLLLFFTPFSTVNINYLNEQWKEITPNIFFLWFLCLCVALIVHISFLFDISYVIAAIVFMLFFSYLSK
jgi:hypothetical protein